MGQLLWRHPGWEHTCGAGIEVAKIHLNSWQEERQVSNHAVAAVYMIILQFFNYFRKMF